MAYYHDEYISMQTYAVLAEGLGYGEKDRSTLTIQREPGGTPYGPPDEYEANDFDIGSLRHTFNSLADAEHLEGAVRKGALKLNPFREIDPQTVHVRKMVFDVHAVEFDDDEREILPVIGALDTLAGRDKHVVMNAFPILRDFRIETPPEPPFATSERGNPQIGHCCFVRACEAIRDRFDLYATPDGRLNSAGMDAKTAFKQLYPGTIYNGPLHGAAEDVGKTLMNISAGNFDTHGTEILRMRFYDAIGTSPVQSVTVRPPTMIEQAVRILAEAEPAAARTIVDALHARKIKTVLRQSGKRSDFDPG